MSVFPVFVDERIRFFRSSAKQSLLEMLCQETPLEKTKALELLQRGSIYVNQKRQSHGEFLLKESDVVRVHFFPRRFDVASNPPQVLHHCEEFLIASKPRGIPVHATVDNSQENVVHYLETLLQRKILVTHRIDIGTRGLLVLALTSDFQRRFNRLLAEKKVTKRYRALVEKNLQPGLYRHYMLDSPRAPKKVSGTPEDGWQLCELKILSCKSIAPFYEVEIELLTGRTHQIRAQLAFLGAPILGDKMYQSPVIGGDPWQGASDSFALDCHYIRFSLNPNDEPMMFDHAVAWEEKWNFDQSEYSHD